MANITSEQTDQVFPASNRLEPGSFNVEPRQFPPSVASSVDAGKVTTDLISKFTQAIKGQNYDLLVRLFLPDGYWRDHLCLSWDLHTLKGRDKIRNFIQPGLRITEIQLDASSDFRSPQVVPLDVSGQFKAVRAFLSISTDIGRGRGVVRLVEVAGEWQILALFTTLTELTGFEEPLRSRRPMGVQHQGIREGQNWREKRNANINMEGTEPVVVIVGRSTATPDLKYNLC
jgi:hypothetical protein